MLRPFLLFLGRFGSHNICMFVELHGVTADNLSFEMVRQDEAELGFADRCRAYDKDIVSGLHYIIEFGIRSHNYYNLSAEQSHYKKMKRPILACGIGDSSIRRS